MTREDAASIDARRVHRVLPTERHVERAAGVHESAETSARFRKRLLEALAPDLELADGETVRLAIDLAARALAKEDPLLGPLMRAGEGTTWARTLEGLDEALSALRGAGVSLRALQTIGRMRGALGPRARVLGAMMAAVDARLAAAGLLDPRAVSQVLARKVAEADPEAVRRGVGVAPGTIVLFEWIVRWDGADVGLVRALDRALGLTGGGARVSLPVFAESIDDRLDPSRVRDPLEIVSDALGAALDEPPWPRRIRARLGRLTAAAPRPADGDVEPRVRITSTGDAEAQARAVVHAVRGVLDRGVPLERVAVGLPSPREDALAPLRSAFAEAELPAYFPWEAPLSGRGFAAVALEVVRVASSGLPRLAVARLASAPYFDEVALTGLASRGAARARLRDTVRALQESASRKGDGPAEALVATAGAPRFRESAERGELRAAVAQRLGFALTPLAVARTRAEVLLAVRHAWGALGLDPSRGSRARETLATDGPLGPAALAEREALARDARAYALLSAALEEQETAVRRLGVSEEPWSAHDLHEGLERAVRRPSRVPAAARAGAVRVAPLDDLAGEPLSLLVVVDANEGTLPPVAGPLPFLSEGLLVALAEYEPACAPAGADLVQARALSALAAAASGAERVLLTYRTQGDEGAPLSPAPFVSALERSGAPSRLLRASILEGPPVSRESALLQRLRQADGAAEAIAPSSYRRARIEALREGYFSPRSRVATTLAGKLGPFAEGDPLHHALAEETGGAARALAVTALEQFAICAFRGFASNVLRARDRPQVKESLDPREAGNLKHAALAEAFRATRALLASRPRDGAAIEARGLTAAETVLRIEEEPSPLRRLALLRLREAVRAVLAHAVADDAWDFAQAEQPFGSDAHGAWPALLVRAGDETLRLTGAIDRVDVAHRGGGVRVLDYKSSKYVSERALRELGQAAFQVPLYACVAAAALQVPPVEGVYLPTRPKDLPAKPSQPSHLAASRWALLLARGESLTEIEARALAVVRDVRTGGLLPAPFDETACDRCTVRGGCRKPRYLAGDEEDVS